MSASMTATKITTKRGSDVGGHEPPVVNKFSIYKFVVTPIILISFLVSLAWIDLRYSLQRPHGTKGGGRGQEGYYHSKQKKLAKMEMAEAFGIRGYVVAILSVLAAAVVWGVGYVVRMAWNRVAAQYGG